jgi:GrpB-like predicted nucleotidyltransferase (UPF0157 family)
MAEPVVVVDYNPEWPADFEKLRQRLAEAVGDRAVSIEHIGSTAVPGLAAKPVIDIDIVLRSSGQVASVIQLLAPLGYHHEGNQGVVGREAFSWPSGERRHHVYVVTRGSPSHRRHLVIRDHLRAHPDEGRAYGELKKRLAETYRDDRVAYAEAKNTFTDRIFMAATMLF